MRLVNPNPRGRLTQRYSAGHRALDIAAGGNAPILSVAPGTVLAAGWEAGPGLGGHYFAIGGGWVVRIRHAFGDSQYAHLSKLLVVKGQRVSAGQPIVRASAIFARGGKDA